MSGVGEIRRCGDGAAGHAARYQGPLPGTLSANLFFGAPSTFAWSAVAKLRLASEQWVLSEIAEIANSRPLWWRAYAADIIAQVHFRLAELEAV